MIYARFDERGVAAWFGPEPITGSDPVDVDPALLLTHRRTPEGIWVPRDPEPDVPLSPEEQAQADAEREEAEAAAREAARKLDGFEFDGVMCSATSKDQSGLTAVLLSIQLQGALFQPTRFEFENGNVLVIHLGNYQRFAAAWVPFRQSFFAVRKEESRR